MFNSYDDWKTTDPRDAERDGPGVKHACLDCGWTGRGAAAFDHHRADHHQIVLAANRQPVIFSCCPDETPDPDAMCGWCGLPNEPRVKGDAACICDME